MPRLAWCAVCLLLLADALLLAVDAHANSRVHKRNAAVGGPGKQSNKKQKTQSAKAIGPTGNIADIEAYFNGNRAWIGSDFAALLPGDAIKSNRNGTNFMEYQQPANAFGLKEKPNVPASDLIPALFDKKLLLVPNPGPNDCKVFYLPRRDETCTSTKVPAPSGEGCYGFVTDEMAADSFYVYEDPNDPSPVVTHCRKSPSKPDPSVAVQEKDGWAAGIIEQYFPGYTLSQRLAQTDYDNSATVIFGVRKDKKWKFFFRPPTKAGAKIENKELPDPPAAAAGVSGAAGPARKEKGQ